ncbi:MAG: class I SAM-dependent methyltransferase [Proteobacteria bacterium]|nr:class I SAM-dependent methyltransferase [Pseudomonadota bacterium]
MTKTDSNDHCRSWYEESYSDAGFKAQRLYPNEELCRFLGREYFLKTAKAERNQVRILELGCGSCSNLWMIAKEGFDAYGIDLSSEGVYLGRKMLECWGVEAQLDLGTMSELPYETNFFDVVVDVFSSYCLCEEELHRCISEISRVLKPGGNFFSYTPGAKSDAFINPFPANKIDDWTLDGIRREDSPYYGNFYPFRFIAPQNYKTLLEKNGFKVSYLETVSRTYNNMQEYFEFVTIVGEKNETY